LLKIALAQIKVIPGRPDLNAQNMLQFIQRAKADQADLILFPEMSIPGYLLGDTWEQPSFLRDCEAWGKTVARPPIPSASYSATSRLTGKKEPMTAGFANITLFLRRKTGNWSTMALSLSVSHKNLATKLPGV
jgi:hypothetical protein